ncbi:MAG: hypothetical protein ABSE62_13470 [Chthoniobacteraceae bacterium]
MTTGSADVGAISADLHGTVVPEGQTTTGWFVYGLTASYTSTTNEFTFLKKSGTLNLVEGAGPLMEDSTYHYAIVATNASGTSTGLDKTFHTHFTVASFAGKYAGAITGTDSASSGLASFTVTTGSSFSGSVELADKKVSFSGKVSSTGTAVSIKSGDTLNLSLVSTGTGGLTVQGAVTGNENTDFVADQLVTTASAQAYTVRLEPPLDTSLPQGYGYGKLTLGKTGSITVTGKLGDGTTLSAGGALAMNGNWALYKPLYKSDKGCIVGTLTFESTLNGDLDGLLNWFKPLSGATGGFSTQVLLYGSTYMKPARGTPIITSTGGYLAFNFANGNLNPSPLVISGTLETTDKVFFGTPPPDDVSISFTTSDGLFTGSFKDPTPGARNAKRTFKGAVFQEFNSGLGEFSGTTETGSVIFAPPP